MNGQLLRTALITILMIALASCGGGGDEEVDSEPTVVEPPAGIFIALSAGGDHTCGILDTGTVACWGLDGDGQSTPLDRTAKTDLVIYSPKVSDNSPPAEASFTLSVTLRNNGVEASAPTTLRYYRSTDATITTSDTLVATNAMSGLAPAASSSRSVQLNAPSTAGTYYYGACVDAGTDESDTTNNCSASVQVEVSELPTSPDLSVGSPSVSDSSLGTSGVFTLSVAASNQGGGEATATTLRYYRSMDATITTSDTTVGTDTVDALSPSGTSARSISLTAPSTAGTYYYGACVDTVSDESDTTNNCSASVRVDVEAPTYPDLSVGSPSVSDSSLETSGAFTLLVAVSNQGDGEATATTLRYYRSTDATITTSDTLVATNAMSGLAPAASSSRSVQLNAPSTAGMYYYGACVDAVDDESDTSNNCSASVQVDVEAPTYPDLSVGLPSVSDASPETGASFTLSATVSNQGDGEAPATTLRYYRSTDATITTSDTPVGTDTVGALSPSGPSAQSISLTAPSAAGTYYYGACVDAVANESDTTNNCSTSLSVTVTTQEDEVESTPSSPSISIKLSPGHQVPMNRAITATLTMRGLDVSSYSSVILRADLTLFGGWERRCNGDDTGKDIEIPVDESEEVFTVKVYNACPYHSYGHYRLVARVFTAADRTELASVRTNFMMSRYLASGDVNLQPPAPGVQAWLDPAPPSVIYVGKWYRLIPRADVRLYSQDYVGIQGFGSEPYLLTTAGQSAPPISVEDSCGGSTPDVVQWRRAIHQAFHIATCKTGTAVILVRHETDAVAPLYRYEFRVLSARTNDEGGTRGKGVSTLRILTEIK